MRIKRTRLIGNTELPDKSKFSSGWDWAVKIWTVGIWKDVRLEATGPARIDWIQIQTSFSDSYRKARIRAHLEIDSLQDVEAKAVFRVLGHNAKAQASVDAVLKKGQNTVEAELVLDDPALWWPNGQGEQPLYVLESRLEDGSGKQLDLQQQRFGVREIRWEQVEGAPADFINPFQLMVNGRPVRTIGSNILPPDCLLGRSGERGLRIVRLAKAAGMNTFRVWGGGITFHKDIYDLADELGMMMSQEFPYHAAISREPAFVGGVQSNVLDIVKQLRNHPCIIEWGGGNEMHWMQGDDHPALLAMERVVSENDDRIFRATCPMQGSYGHSPYIFWVRWEPYLGLLGVNAYQA